MRSRKRGVLAEQTGMFARHGAGVCHPDRSAARFCATDAGTLGGPAAARPYRASEPRLPDAVEFDGKHEFR